MARRRKTRSDAARRGWATRRQHAAAAAAEFKRRSDAAREGWRRRKRRQRRSAEPDPTLWPVYDVREFWAGAELGFARTVAQAIDVAEAARPDDEVDTVTAGFAPPDSGYHRAYLAVYRRDDEPMEPDDDFADEWEIGFEYRGADRNSHVDVNIRIAREDGEAFGAREAQRVLTEFRNNLSREDKNPIPDGYLMAMIDWKRPRWGTEWESGGEGDLISFHAPMYTESSNPDVWSIVPTGNVRFGSVKP